MRISKRDRLLLIVLAFVAVFAIYYFFLMHPKEKSISDLEVAYEQWLSMKSDVDAKLMTDKILDYNLEDLQEQVKNVSFSFYDDISQEEIVALLSKYAEGTNINLSEMQITPNLSTVANALKYQTTVTFEGTYDDLLGYIRTVRNNEKNIILNDIVITNNFVDVLNGRITFEFNAVPNAKEFIASSEKLISSRVNTRDVLAGPFLPYDSFNVSEATEEVPIYTDETEPVDYEDYVPKTQIYSFEEGDFFFVANNEDIIGDTNRNKTKIAGGYSAELNFDFIASRPFSEANLVFDINKVMLTKQADTIGMWIYAYEASNHKIGIVIIDSKGKEYRVELTNNVDWTQWNEVEASMPVEITYPCMIQRIYVEGIGYDQKITGKYLFDQLEVAYPVE